MTIRVTKSGSIFVRAKTGFWTPSLTSQDPEIPNLPLETAAAGGQTLTLACAAGAYTYTGQASTLKRAITLTCEAGSYTYTGQTSTLTHARTLTCEVGAYTYTGQTSTLTHARSLTCAAGSYASTGQAATLTHARTLVCAAGAYTYAGKDATLTKSGIQTLTLACDAGSYVYTGKTTTLIHARSLTCAAGTYAYSGQSSTLTHARSLTCAAGGYGYTGQDATLTAVTAQSLTLTCDSGSYTYTGQNISFSGSVTTKQGNTGGYFDIYTGRKKEPQRKLKRKLKAALEEQDKIIDVIERSPQRFTGYVAKLNVINGEIESLKAAITDRQEQKLEENNRKIEMIKRKSIIIRMLLL